MVSLREMSPKQLLFLFIAITLLLSGAIYTMQKQGVGPASGLVESKYELSVNNDDQLVINFLDHSIGQSIDLKLNPDEVEKKTGYRPEEPIEIEAKEADQFIEYSLDNETKTTLYNLEGPKEIELDWLGRISEDLEACRNKISDYPVLTKVYIPGWTAFGKYRSCYGLSKAGTAYRTNQPDYGFEQEFEITHGTDKETLELSTEDPVEKMDDLEIYEDQGFGHIRAIGFLDSLNKVGLDRLGWVTVSGDDVRYEVSDPTGLKTSDYMDCARDEEYTKMFPELTITETGVEECYNSHLDYDVIKENLNQEYNYNGNLKRYLDDDERAKHTKFEIRVDADWVEEVEVNEPLPDPEIKNFKIPKDELKSGTTYEAMYEVCNERDDEENSGKVWKSLSSTGGYLFSSMASETKEIPAGECINGTIDVQVGANERTTDEITLTMSPLSLGEGVSEDTASETVTILPGEGDIEPDGPQTTTDTDEELTGFFFGQNKKTIGLIGMIVSSLMILAGVYIRYGK